MASHVADYPNAPAPRVLLVDDDPDVRFEIMDSLSDENMVVTDVGNAREALDILQANPGITVVLSDVVMPGMDGLNFAERVQEMFSGETAVGVVLMTGTRRAEAPSSAVFRLLYKPARREAILEAIADAHAFASGLRAAAGSIG